MTDELVRSILIDFPRVYIACHRDHARRRGQGSRTTSRDATILSHISAAGIRPIGLARHLKVGPPTLSAALKRLTKMKLVNMSNAFEDKRGKIVHITELGKQTIADASVLNATIVKNALDRLKPADRNAVARGLRLLADAAQHLQSTSP